MSYAYTASGVSLAEGDSFSAFAGRICKESFLNSPFVVVTDLARDHFRGPRGFQFVNLPKGCYIDVAPDGIGTKVVLIDAAGNRRTAANNLLAMTEGDITRWGGLPLLLVNLLDVKTLGKSPNDSKATPTDIAINNHYREMISGMGEACREQGIVCYRGETAELGHCVSSENTQGLTQFNWGGMALGVYNPSTLINGETLKPGQLIMALRDPSPRSNGYSLLRKGLGETFGDRWYTNPKAKEIITAAAEPAALYGKLLSTANGWFEKNFKPLVKIHLIVHLTGGSFHSKFAEDILFPLGLSAVLDNLWPPPAVVQECAEWMDVPDDECYKIFSAGQGVLVVIDKEDEESFNLLATSLGIESQRCGKITTGKTPNLTILSKFRGEKIVWCKQ